MTAHGGRRQPAAQICRNNDLILISGGDQRNFAASGERLMDVNYFGFANCLPNPASKPIHLV